MTLLVARNRDYNVRRIIVAGEVVAGAKERIS